jgi:hypothetical protein
MSKGTDLKMSSIELIIKFTKIPEMLLINPKTTPSIVPKTTAQSVRATEFPKPFSIYEKSFMENSLTKFMKLIPEQFSI